MDMDIVLARIKRSKLSAFAGDSFRDTSSDIVTSLNSDQYSNAIVGIQKTEYLYTIISRRGLIARNKVGSEVDLSVDEALPYLKENAMKVGKGGDFEFIEFGSNGSLWMKDGPTMCAIWNILMFVHQRIGQNLT